MNINIKNCNNIDEGNISIKENKLNIKFGINGTGKSTIAKAIQYSKDEFKDLFTLSPFKLLENSDKKLKPEISGIDNIQNVFIFDEDYVKQFIFKQEELIENSFDIFIKTPTYQKKVEEIESLVLDITSIFKNNQDLNITIDEFKKLSENFKITKDGMSKASKGYKSLIDGNKIKNIPQGLEPYKVFLQSDKNVDWLNWHNEGEIFLEMSNNCPYCASIVIDKKDQIKKITNEYDKNFIKNLELLIKIIEKLGEYFSDETIYTLKKITTKKEGLEKAEEIFLISVKKQIDDLIDKFEKLKNISYIDFKNDEKVEDVINPLVINIDFYDHLRSSKTEEIIHNLNHSLNNVLQKINDLQKQVNEQKSEVKQLIKKHQDEINQFLENAGFKYRVKIEDVEYKLKLKHLDSSSLLSGGEQHLSFGEKNAFSLALFMYDVLSKKPDLIILDDPISSFDNSKKYAIMDMLFRKEKNLRGKTVLMLTHDIEPIINTIKVFNGEYLAEAYFLEFKNGILSEKEIKNNHLLTFPQICDEMINSKDVDDLIKLIYLRRYYEVLGKKDDEYQILSNLFHKRAKSKAKDTRKKEDNNLMDDKNFENGIKNIKEIIHNFNYELFLKRICSTEEIKKIYNLNSNNYEKLQLFRILDINFADDKILAKFINESYHIENEFINQLNPLDFNLVPEFIIKECDKIMELSN